MPFFHENRVPPCPREHDPKPRTRGQGCTGLSALQSCQPRQKLTASSNSVRSRMNPLFKPAPTEVFAGGVAQLPSPWAHSLHKPVFIGFLVSFASVWVTLLLGIPFSAKWRWLEGLFWLLAAATSLVGLARRLPGQNAAMSSVLVTAISGGVAAIAAKTGVPFG